MPDAQPAPGTKYVDTMKDEVVAGQPCVWVSNVTRPTMTVYSPKVRKFRGKYRLVACLEG